MGKGAEIDKGQLLDRRRRVLGKGLSMFYRSPLCIVRGEGVWVWDEAGRRYLDTYNNVPVVGHCHPKVVEAICAQAKRLNTHTRYVHPTLVEYAERLTALLDDSLNALTLTCTGSEANDLALRIAQACTGNTGIVCTTATYHGNTALVTQLSGTRPPIGGRAGNIRQVRPPSELEPIGAEEGLSQGEAFARQVEQAIEELERQECGFACLILCPLFANEGFPKLERGFLDEAAKLVRKHGGVIIADEVQCGFGRTGGHMWGHERLGFVPEIMTLGKPIANGHPVGAVVTSAELLGCFQERYRYFNTFGGNPVASAAALATLEVLQEEGLVENARAVGAYALELLAEIKPRHPIIASVRGAGLFFGAELDRGLVSGVDAKDIAADISEAIKDRGVLTGISGWHRTILKMRPPLPYSRENVDRLAEALDQALGEVMAKHQ